MVLSMLAVLRYDGSFVARLLNTSRVLGEGEDGSVLVSAGLFFLRYCVQRDRKPLSQSHIWITPHALYHFEVNLFWSISDWIHDDLNHYELDRSFDQADLQRILFRLITLRRWPKRVDVETRIKP